MVVAHNQAEVGEEYQQLRASVKDAKRVFADDAGWRINGESAYMMGFDTDEASVYQIRLRHRHQGGGRELIPSDYGGVMRTDRALTYDAWALELMAQQKCCYHIICSIDKVLEDKAGSARNACSTKLAGITPGAIYRASSINPRLPN